MTYIINLFGIGIRYWICDLPVAMYDEMHQILRKHKVEWEQLLFDFDLLAHFGYTHWSQLSAYPKQTGFLLDPENRIEIKQGAKFIARFRANELKNDTTLFPLYQSSQTMFQQQHNPGYKTFLLIQYEKGLIGKYKLDCVEFHFDFLEFKLLKMNSFSFLSELNYRNKTITKLREDALTMSNQVVII